VVQQWRRLWPAVVRYGGGRLGAVATTTSGSCGCAKWLPVWRRHGQEKKTDVVREG